MKALMSRDGVRVFGLGRVKCCDAMPGLKEALSRRERGWGLRQKILPSLSKLCQNYHIVS